MITLRGEFEQYIVFGETLKILIEPSGPRQIQHMQSHLQYVIFQS